MVRVNVSDFNNLDKALRVFKLKVRRAHIFEIVNKKSHYISPSEKRHRSRSKRGQH